MLTVADASSLTKENIKGAVLAVPKIFYYDSKAPQCWGYVVKVPGNGLHSQNPTMTVGFFFLRTALRVPPCASPWTSSRAP